MDQKRSALAMQSGRLDGFVGSDQDYIAYLELTILELRKDSSYRSDSLAKRVRASSHTANVITTPTGALDASQWSPNRLSASAHNQAQGQSSVQDDNRGSLPSFQLLQWTPDNLSASAQNQAQGQRASEPLWKALARALIAETPPACSWARSVKALGLIKCARDDSVIVHLLPDNAPPDQECGFVGLIKAYLHSDKPKTVTTPVAIMIANFRQLLVCSACVVVRDLEKEEMQGGMQPDMQALYDIIKLSFGGNLSDDYCRRIIGTARYINKLIANLDSRGWAFRASELFLIWNRPLTSYIKLYSSPKESLPCLTDGLSKARFVTAGNGEIGLEHTAICVSTLVHTILGKRVQYVAVHWHEYIRQSADKNSLARVRKILGHVHFRESINPHRWCHIESTIHSPKPPPVGGL